MKHADMIKKDKKARKDLLKYVGNKPLMVGAGAGAGKTTSTVSAVIESLQKGIKPEEICLITFTNKATQEMIEKGIKVIDERISEAKTEAQKEELRTVRVKLQKVHVSTIHSFAYEVIRGYPLEAGIGYAYRYESPEETMAYLKSFLRKHLQSPALKRCMEMGFCKNPEPVNAVIKRFKCMLDHLDAETMNEKTGSMTYQDARALLAKEAEKLRLAALKRLNADDMVHVAPAFYNILSDPENIKDDAKLFRFFDSLLRYGLKIICWAGETYRKNPEKLNDFLAEHFFAGYDKKDIKKWQETIRTDVNAYCDAMKLPKLEGYNRTQKALEMIKCGACTCPEKPFINILLALTEMLCAVNRSPLLDTISGIELSFNGLKQNLNYFTDCIVTEELENLKTEYIKARRRDQRISDNECLLLAEEMLKAHPEIRKELHERYRLIFVDEYQDTDPVQVKLIIAIIADSYDPADWRNSRLSQDGRIVCIGDPKQSIYSFRRADITLWDETMDFLLRNGGRTVQFLRNFRSTQPLCNHFNAVFGKNGSLALDGADGQVEYEDMVSGVDSAKESPRGSVHYHSVSATGKNKKELPEQLAKQTAPVVIKTILDIRKSENCEFGDFLLLTRERHTTKIYVKMFRDAGIPLLFNGRQNYNEFSCVGALVRRVGATALPQNEVLLLEILKKDFGVSLEAYTEFIGSLTTLVKSDGSKYPCSLPALISIAESPDMDAVASVGPAQEHIVTALRILLHDRRNAKKMSPIDFLTNLIDSPDGIFRFEMNPQDVREEYSVVSDVLDIIRTAEPEGLADMYEKLSVFGDLKMDKMPDIRADNKFVRMMNLHQAKGLEAKYVFLLPDEKDSSHTAECYLQRVGSNEKVWYSFIHNSVEYPGAAWIDVNAGGEESKRREQEEKRLLYVAATRAGCELHIFEREKGLEKSVWKGIEGGSTPIAIEVDGKPETFIPLVAEPCPPVADDDIFPAPSPSKAPVLPNLRDNLDIVNASGLIRVAPSKAKKGAAIVDTSRFETIAVDAGSAERTDLPGGTVWGTMIHRAADLLVKAGVFTAEALETAARQSVFESMSHLLEDPEARKTLLLGENTDLYADRALLIERLKAALSFMLNESSALRKLIDGNEVFSEVPFVLSRDRKGSQEEISGTMDLLIHTADGWILVDYKTDRPLIGESNEKHASRVASHYASQMHIYAESLESLTGQKVIKKYLCLISCGGTLITV